MTSSDEKRRVRGMLAWPVTGAFWIALAAYASSYPLNHDVGWFLYGAEALLHAATLNVDIIEVNSPVSTYLSMVPVALGGILDVSPILVGHILLLSLCLASAVWSALIVRNRPGGPTSPMIFLALGVAFLGLPGMDWGQREHLMFVLVTPYMVLGAERVDGRDIGGVAPLFAGFAAGLGFALKPHFVIPWLAIEAYILVRDGSVRSWLRRTELRTALGTVLSCAIAVSALHPEYFAFVWNARGLYRQFVSGSRLSLAGHPLGFPLLAAFVFLLASRRIWTRPRSISGILLSFALGAWLIAIGQGKGWSYHYYPALASATVAGVLLLADFLRSAYLAERVVEIPAIAAAVLLGAALYVVPARLIAEHRHVANMRTQRISVERMWIEDNAIGSLAILSPAVPSSFPLVNYTGVGWASPFSSLWWIEAAHGRRDLPGDGVPMVQDSVEQSLLQRWIDRVEAVEPDAVLVDTARSERFGGAAFPYVAYLSQDPRFREFWRYYARDGVLGRYAVYRRHVYTER
jgi:hypothetical protein